MTPCSSASGWRSRLAFGAFDGEELIGYVEGSPESWNNRFRISNICVFENAKRGSGVGTKLLGAIQAAAASSGARMIVLQLLGILLGVYMANRMDTTKLRKMVAWVCLFCGGFILVNAIRGILAM